MRRRLLLSLGASLPAAALEQQPSPAGPGVPPPSYPVGAMPAEGLVQLAEAARPPVIQPRFAASAPSAVDSSVSIWANALIAAARW